MLLENLVASTLFYLSNKYGNYFTLYYDLKVFVMLILLFKRNSRNLFQLKLVWARKLKQISSAINRYNAVWGIIISNTTKTIKNDNFI